MLDYVAEVASVDEHLTINRLRGSMFGILYSSGIGPDTLGGLDNQIYPERFRRFMEVASRDDTSMRPVDPLAFVTEVLAISNVLLQEKGAKAVAPIVLTGTAVEFFLKRLALAKGSNNTTNSIEAWAGALKGLGVISKKEKNNRIDNWRDYRNMAVHDESDELTLDDARQMNREFAEFVAKYGHALS